MIERGEVGSSWGGGEQDTHLGSVLVVSTLNFLLNFLADLVQVGILVVGEEMRGQERLWKRVLLF